jgi:1-acyl-sn-glycerol-3-phosphate acyltransferase
MNEHGLHASAFEAWCSDAIYETTFVFSAAAMTLGWSLRTEGRQHIPSSGPALLISNHQSFLDPILVGLGTRRHLCYLARKTLFRHRALAWLIRMLNAVPIDHDGVGKEGIKTVLQALESGQAVVVFPEGHRTPDGAMLPLRAGIQLLIKRTKAPIVPVGIAGAFQAWPSWRHYPLPAPLFLPASPRCLAVCVGKPLDASRFAALPRQQTLEELHGAIESVRKRAERLRRKA